MIFAHCSKLEKRKKWKTLIIFFEAIICQTDGLSSNSRVTEKIEELVNLVSFEHVQLKFSKLKRKLACLHTTLGSALKSSPFFSFFFLYSCPPMYPYYLAWSTENQPTRFSLHIQLQLLCWKTILLLHTDPNAKKKKSFTKGLRQKLAWIFQPPMKQFLFGWFYFDSPTLLFWYSKIQNNKEIHSEIVSVELIQNMAHSFKYFIGLNNFILFLLLWILKYQKSIVHSNEK